MRLLLTIVSLTVMGVFGTAHAAPLEQINYYVFDTVDSTAIVQITWNNDDAASMYSVGCVSCIPNMSVNTIEDSVFLEGVTAIKDGIALLYIVAYDASNEIIAAKQILVEIK